MLKLLKSSFMLSLFYTCLASGPAGAAEGIDSSVSSLPFNIKGTTVMTLNPGGLMVGTATAEASISTTGPIILGDTVQPCTSATAGAMRFNRTTKAFEGCNGTGWGAIYNPTAMKIVTHSETLCTRGSRHTITSTCPAGSYLLACGGGPGDQGEANEYWVLMPDFKANSCIGYSGEPACYDTGESPNMSAVLVTAVCYQTSTN
jgi:hypothetical protein